MIYGGYNIIPPSSPSVTTLENLNDYYISYGGGAQHSDGLNDAALRVINHATYDSGAGTVTLTGTTRVSGPTSDITVTVNESVIPVTDTYITLMYIHTRKGNSAVYGKAYISGGIVYMSYYATRYYSGNSNNITACYVSDVHEALW